MNEISPIDPGTETGFRVLWLAGSDLNALVCIEALTAAREQAREKWPGFGAFFAELLVIWPLSDEPPGALVQAAGTGFRRIDSDLSDLVAWCDIAIIGYDADVAIAGLLPMLFAPVSSGKTLVLDIGGAHALYGDGRRAAFAPIPSTVEALLDNVFAPPHDDGETRKLLEYLAEDDTKRAHRHSYSLLLPADEPRAKPNEPPQDLWDSAIELTAQHRPGAAAGLTSLRAAHERADALAIAYGKRWRSALVMRSLGLAAASATSGLIGALFPHLVIATIPIQTAATIIILVDRRIATRGRWREKWLEYRMLAERLRVDRFLVICGGGARRNDVALWTDWFGHRIARPIAPLDGRQAPAALRHLVDVEIPDQVAYQWAALCRFRALDRRMRRLANGALIGLVSLAIIIAALAFTPYALGTGSPWSVIGLALSVAPAIHATLNSVRRDLDVARQAERSSRVHSGLKRLAELIALAPQDAATARAAASRAAYIMIDDVKSWRAVYEVL